MSVVTHCVVRFHVLSAGVRARRATSGLTFFTWVYLLRGVLCVENAAVLVW